MEKNKEIIEVNYRNKKRYKTAKLPLRQPLFFTWLIHFLSSMALLKRDYKIEKINMEGLKAPYLLLSNHMYFVDFELISKATYPQRINNVISIDGYYRRPWLMTWIGGIATRKFTQDLHLIKSMRHVFKNGDVVGLYPEARYTASGTTAYLPESLGKIVKLSKVPVVVAIHRGNHLETPFWNYKKKRKVPLHTTLTQILTTEDINKLSVDEINAKIQEAFVYDEYKYQKENNILITEKYRAEGLHKILYQCPHCKHEEMGSKGTQIYCKHCGKHWNLNENGSLQALEGETEFSHIPDWYNWERLQVREEILNGTYSFFDDVDVYSLPRCYRYMHLGKAKVRHTIDEGFVLEGFYRGKDYRIVRHPIQSNSLHIEYDYVYTVGKDCFNISVENDSYFCFPTKENVITKLGFAVEELYLLKMKEIKK